MRLSADLNNMSWRVRPEEVLLEVGKPFGSKLGLQKITEVLFLYKTQLNFVYLQFWSHLYNPSIEKALCKKSDQYPNR